MSKVQNNATIVSTCNQRITALGEYVKPKTVMQVNGQPMKVADVTGVYQACIATRSELVKQRAAYEKALEARDSAEATRQATDKGLRAWVTGAYGAESQEALEFGFLPTKVTEKSAATKATAVLKLRATREARNTMGKRQKKDIKGTIVAPAAPAEPAITAPAAAPTASAPTTTNGAPSGAAPSNGVAASH